jgi:hypothetical protein
MGSNWTVLFWILLILVFSSLSFLSVSEWKYDSESS